MGPHLWHRSPRATRAQACRLATQELPARQPKERLGVTKAGNRCPADEETGGVPSKRDEPPGDLLSPINQPVDLSDKPPLKGDTPITH